MGKGKGNLKKGKAEGMKVRDLKRYNLKDIIKMNGNKKEERDINIIII